MTFIDIIQLASSGIFLVAGASLLLAECNLRKARRQYQATIERMNAAERGVPFQ